MYRVEMYARVRRACRVEGMGTREASRGRCHVNHRVTSLWAPTPEIMQRSSLAATVSSRRRGIGGVFGGRPVVPQNLNSGVVFA